MRSHHPIDDDPGYQSLFEELRSRTARLERLVKVLFVAVLALFSALGAMAGDLGSAGAKAEAAPPTTVGPHGNYCLSDQGAIFLSSLGSDGPGYREFERLCESRGGEVLWRP